MRLDFEGKIDKKEEYIHILEEQVVILKDDRKGKAEAIAALSETLLSKALENQKLSEMLTEIKNHHLNTLILN